ncbi:MAG: hypothetical protein JWL70_1497, partial [Acidimicrobiia bacterium]|nr:hypothetical protein [Acidimicrobiia bacterium]
MALFTAASRLTGVARVVVAVNVLQGYLGNTYQLANRVPNVLFELFAAGALQAAVIPGLVQAQAEGGDRSLHEVANIVLGRLLVALGALVAVAMALSPLLMRLLAVSADSAEIRSQQVRLGVVLLLIFLPQVLCYAGGLVASAVLNVKHHFVAPVIAPMVNNVVVIACYAVFWHMTDGAHGSLHLSPGQVAVLGGGTTAAVLAFTAVPLMAARRAGVSLRPRWGTGDSRVRTLART